MNEHERQRSRGAIYPAPSGMMGMEIMASGLVAISVASAIFAGVAGYAAYKLMKGQLR